MNKILLVDDDPVLTRHYAEALRLQGYEVDVFSAPGEALLTNFDDYVLLVADLMMPGGIAFPDSQSKQGMIAGVLLIEAMRAKGFRRPCALLTNLNITAIADEVSRRLATVENAVLMKKSEFNPIEFASVAAAIISGDMRKNLSPTLFDRLKDSLLLRPTFFGVGVDLKRLFGVKE